MTASPPVQVSSWRWWEGWRRLAYNLVLLGTLAVGWAMLVVSAFVLPLPPATPGDELPEFTIFTVFFQAIGTAAGLVAANIAYLAGPLGDLITPARFRDRYRKGAYAAGVLVSVIVIIGIPLVSFGQGVARALMAL